MLCIIYILRNRINNLVYIGQTWRPLKKRFRGYSEKQIHLFRAIKTYGKESFFYEVLTVAHTQKIADYWECYFIDKFDSIDPNKGYNLKTGGIGGRYVGRIGEIRKQWIAKMKINGKQQYESNSIIKEALEKNKFKPGRAAPNKGKPMSDEQYNEWLPFAFKKGEHISFETEFKSGERRSIATEFKPGQIPHNKGQNMLAAQKNKCAPTMFKSGQIPHNKKQFSLNEEYDIILRYKQGESVASIARKYDCSFAPITRIIKNS
jgi:group I intron endonuclease